MLRCGLCMGYGARARVQVGIRTEVEPVWGHTPSIAPISLPSAALGLLPCAHLAQRSAIPRSKTEFYTPFCGTVKGMKVVETMWTGREKINDDGSHKSDHARCVARGDLHAKYYHVTSNQTMSPVVRTPSLNAIDAVSVLRRQHTAPFDVPGAYLQGKQLASEQIVCRSPPGFRRYDERGVEILWLMQNPLYGQGDAGAIWNRT